MNPDFSEIKIDSPTPEVAHADAEKYFQWLWPALELGGQEYGPNDLAAELLSGDVLLMRVWIEGQITGLAAARLRTAGDGRELYVMALVGEKADKWLLPLSDAFDQLAAETECVAVVLEGRPGWSKKLRGLGYSLHQVTMRKGLDNGRHRLQ